MRLLHGTCSLKAALDVASELLCVRVRAKRQRCDELPTVTELLQQTRMQLGFEALTHNPKFDFEPGGTDQDAAVLRLFLRPPVQELHTRTA
jgi:hypothetical protein